VLSLDAVDRMRAHVFANRGTASTAEVTAEPSTVVYHATPREIFWFGIVSNRGMVVVAAALGFMWQLDPVERWVEPTIREHWSDVETLSTLRWAAIVPFAIAALVLFWILLRVLSVVWAFVQLHDFRLSRQGDDLRAEYGLLTRVSKTIPRHRVQLLSVRETALHRLLGRVSIQVETAGGSGDNEGGGGAAALGKLWLAPIVPRREMAAIVRETLPGVDPESVSWSGVAPRARARWFRQRMKLLLPAVAALAILWSPWILLSLAVLLPAAWYGASQQARHTGWAVAGDAVFFRSGWWTRRTSMTRIGKIQALDLTSTPFDRRARMASLRVDTAGAGRLGHRIDVPFLEATVAAELLDRLAAEAGRTAFRW
jgi:putative membrane protein